MPRDVPMVDASEPSPAAGPRALLRLLDVLSFLAARKTGATLSEIGSALDVPVSSLLAILRVLVGQRYLERHGMIYVIGSGSHDLAHQILGGSYLGSLALNSMQKLSLKVGETVILARADDEGSQVVYTDVVECESAVRYTVKIGDTRPYYASAAGRVVLAFKDEDWVARYLGRVPLEAVTPRTLTDRTALYSALEDVRRKHVSVSIEECTDGGAGVAAPIFGHDGKLAAVLTIGAVATRVRTNGARYREAAKDSANEISKLLKARSVG